MQYDIIVDILMTVMFWVLSLGLILTYYDKHKSSDYKILIVYAFSKFMCGATLLVQISPGHYLFNITIKTITIISCLLTTIYVYPLVKRFRSYKAPQEYLEMIAELRRVQKEHINLMKNVQEANHKLVNRIQYLENMSYTQGWLSRTELKLGELRAVVNEFRKNYESIRTSSDQVGEPPQPR